MGWYYYFEEGLKFPIEATVKLALRGGKSEEKGVKIVELKSGNEDKPVKLGIVEGESERVQYKERRCWVRFPNRTHLCGRSLTCEVD